MQKSLLTDEFFQSLESSARDVELAEMLPPACYTDRDFWEFEKEAIFSREWLCVGREAWAKNPGDYFTSAHMGEPIVIVRNREGVLKAMSTVCQHRAMLVVEGRGNAKAFLCPYHHWSYSLDGELIGAPAMDKTCGFDPKKVRLGQLKLECWLGFVFVNFDLHAPPLTPRLVALTKVLERYDISNCDEPPHGETWTKCPWNWKVHVENSNDGYHANRLHKGPVHDLCPSSMASFPVDLPPDTAGSISTWASTQPARPSSRSFHGSRPKTGTGSSSAIFPRRSRFSPGPTGPRSRSSMPKDRRKCRSSGTGWWLLARQRNRFSRSG
jgi:phenylpropionate dioxygenase-like ring-hydroxylating dioxygenase large terminal subunit